MHIDDFLVYPFKFCVNSDTMDLIISKYYENGEKNG